MNLRTNIQSASLIWLSTGVLGSLFHTANETSGLPFIIITLLSLALSLPALIFLIPNLYILNSIQERTTRILYAVFSIVVLSAIVVAAFLVLSKGIYFERGMRKLILLPYCFAAEISFFLIAGKLILVKD